jgi:hypothetical protein
MKGRIFLLFIIHVTFLSSAQILKVDKGSLLLDSARILIGNVGLNFDIHNRSATSEKEITFVGLKGTSDIVYLSEKHAYISINTIQYFKSTGGPLTSNGYSHFRVNFLRMRKLSYETYTQVQYDDGRSMPFRFLYGGGIRLRLKESKKISAHAGIGIMNELEHWKNISTDNSINQKQILKTSDYIGATLQLTDYASIMLTLFYQGGLDNKDDVFRNRVSSDFQLKIKMTNKISFLASCTFQYEDKPIIPIRKLVYSVHNGLMWNF